MTPVAAQGEPPRQGQPQVSTPARTVAPVRSGRSVDILDLRDSPLPNGTGHLPTPPVAGVGAIVCEAGCDGQRVISKSVERSPSSSGPNSNLILAGISAPTADLPKDGPVATVGMIECIAGCYAGDRKTMLATGGPTATMTAAVSRPMVAVVAGPVRQPAVTPDANTSVPTETVKFRTAYAPYGTSRAYTPRSTRSRVAKAKPMRELPKVAALGPVQAQRAPTTLAATVPTPAPSPVPSPVAATPTAEPTAIRKRAVMTPSKRAVASNDWFNRINRERETKAKAATQSSAD